jgi:hypothetical protein
LRTVNVGSPLIHTFERCLQNKYDRYHTEDKFSCKVV